jgi:DNA repair exonuclease SbcCD nuclease subunit
LIPHKKAPTLKRGAHMTDIHFGKRGNSVQHNEDCLRFIDWFCDQVKRDGKIDYVAFLGDWNENRSALNISTLNYSYQGAKKLNDLGIPVYFVIGNHDLYHRNSREVHSIIHFQEFKNFVVIDKPIIIDNIEGKMLFSPYLFPNEYPDLSKYLSLPFWAGHFEFKGFEVTGTGMKMPVGPDPKDFPGPKYIASGHFHKRQADENIIYVGNCFPMDFGDAGDNHRGMMIYDHIEQDMNFIDWVDCPKYIKTELSTILDKSQIIQPDSRVKVLVDIPITFEESNYLRKTFTENYNLREFVLEESTDIQQAITNTNIDPVLREMADKLSKLSSIDDLVHLMLKEIESDHIDPNKLIEIYRNLKI